MVVASVVIPSRKPTADIEAFTATDWHSDDEVEVLIQREPSVTRARNAGIRRASSDKIVFLDDDSIPGPDYLSQMTSVLDEEAAVAGRTIHPRSDVFERIASHYEFGRSGRYVTCFWGCNMAVRTEVFETVGLWDERMSWGHEEKELANRVLEEYPIYYDPAAVVRHSYADSLLGYWKKRYRLEKQTPYYWETKRIEDRDKWIKIGQDACDPTKYVGLSLTHTLARAGGNVASLLGRLRGMSQRRRADVGTNAVD